MLSNATIGTIGFVVKNCYRYIQVSWHWFGHSVPFAVSFYSIRESGHFLWLTIMLFELKSRPTRYDKTSLINPVWCGAQSLVYIISSWIARATQRDPVSKQQ